jgi:BirA family biotin operon repressor/biotin-[acetyl-CoA-carboxylase] ligase
LVAAQLPAWNAVRADTQTKGRGRFERNWVSDAGGLWLSAVLPIRQKSAAWRFLPVAIGFAVCQALGSLGVRDLRLRWPNDVLVGRLKLAGLLLDQFSANLVVAGIGINVRNRPENCDGSLAGQTTRLCDLISHTPGLTELAPNILEVVRTVWIQLEENGPECLLPQVNNLWQAPRLVKLDLDGHEVQGEFVGVDDKGRLELRQSKGPAQFFEPHNVRCLREIP